MRRAVQQGASPATIKTRPCDAFVSCTAPQTAAAQQCADGLLLLQNAYMARDAAELRAAAAQPNEALRDEYRGMQLTERLVAPAASAEPAWAHHGPSVQQQVTAYRRMRGLPDNVRACLPRQCC